jgi:predicted AAA+ superfamily ATPase
MEAGSERQRMVNPRKAYPVDPGLIPVFDRSGRPNLGHALETAVLVELERRRAAVTYVRTPSGREVDFLARHWDGSRELIQVCADPTDAQTTERELLALQEAGDLFKQATRKLLVLNRDAWEPEVPRGVIVQPAWRWLLSPG